MQKGKEDKYGDYMLSLIHIWAKGFIQDENGWVELNATADGLTANAIPKGQEVLIVIGEGLEKERIEAVSYTHLDVYKRQVDDVYTCLHQSF